jgi:predicted regulator of amino acid metabolism with ACT domain
MQVAGDVRSLGTTTTTIETITAETIMAATIIAAIISEARKGTTTDRSLLEITTIVAGVMLREIMATQAEDTPTITIMVEEEIPTDMEVAIN